MADIIETTAAVDENDDWTEGIYQLEEEDVVLGGPDGIDNLQAKQLAARTNRLRLMILAALAGLDDHEAAADPHPQYLTEAEGNALIAAAVAALVDASPAALDTLNELAAALGDDPNFATTITNALALKAPLDSPALTGNPTAPTQDPGDNSTKLANTAFVAAAIAAISIGAATETVAGLVELATDGEAQAFAANKAIDGAKLATAFKGSNQSLTSSGYQRLPGGLIIQWGLATGSSGSNDVASSFPITFPNGCFLPLVFSGVSASSFCATLGGYTASTFSWSVRNTTTGSRVAGNAVVYLALGH
jgi:hypothetical protein